MLYYYMLQVLLLIVAFAVAFGFSYSIPFCFWPSSQLNGPGNPVQCAVLFLASEYSSAIACVSQQP